MRLLLALVVVLTCCVACDDDPSSPSAHDTEQWMHSTDPVTTTGITFATGSLVQLADATIDVGVTVGAFALAGDGVYFVESNDPPEDFSPSHGTHELMFAGRDGNTVPTGIDILTQTLRASPNGRYLTAVDMGSGEKDQFGTPQAALVVWDLQAGKEIIRSTDATGDPDTDDLAALYPDLEMRIRTITDTGLILEAAGYWSYDFASGSATEIEHDDLPEEPPSFLINPTGTWRVDHHGSDQLLLGPDGATVQPQADPAKLELWGWWDDTTAYGVLDGSPPAFITCTVPTGACAVIDGAAGQQIVLPNGVPDPGFDLRSAVR